MVDPQTYREGAYFRFPLPRERREALRRWGFRLCEIQGALIVPFYAACQLCCFQMQDKDTYSLHRRGWGGADPADSPVGPEPQPWPRVLVYRECFRLPSCYVGISVALRAVGS